VARDGIEPPTPAFSGLSSIKSNLLKTLSQSILFGQKAGFKCNQVQPNGSFRFAHNHPYRQANRRLECDAPIQIRTHGGAAT